MEALIKTKKKLTVYTAGSIESAEDPRGWRNELTPFLESLNFEVKDPCALEQHKLSGLHPERLPEGITHWHGLKNRKEPHLRARFMSYMRKIILFDIDIVKNSDFIILLWDRWSSGSSGEVTCAFIEGIPVYTVATIEAPAWIHGCSSKVFSNFDQLRKFLTKEYGNQE